MAAFLAVFGALFVLMALAVRPARRVAATAGTTRIVLGFALLFRLLLIPAGLPVGGASPFGPPPDRTLWEVIGERASSLGDDLAGRRTVFREHLLYDDDLWRYLWDGHVAAAGANPYLRSPAEVEEDIESRREAAVLLADPWPDVLDRVGFPTYRTVYPPVAQLLFVLAHLVAPASVVAWKLLVIAADLGTCALLVRLLRHLRRPSGDAVLYAWNPLAVKEIAGSGHVDAAMVLLAVLAVERVVAGRARTGLAALGASALVKLGSAVLAPALLAATRPRAWWPLPAVAALFCLPFVNGLPALAGSLGVYGEEWTFNGGPWRLIAWLASAAGAARPEVWARAICLGGLVAVVALTVRRVRGPGERVDAPALVTAAFAALAAAAWLAPAVMPWYLLWALPFAVATGRRSWLLLCALSLLSYLVYSVHAERAWWLWLEHGAFAAALLAEEIRGRRVRA